MSEELKPQAQAAPAVATTESAYLEEVKKIDDPAGRLKESLEGLEDYGDFDLLETMADGIENMNPESRAAKRIFLQDGEFAEQRERLKTDLLMWSWTVMLQLRLRLWRNAKKQPRRQKRTCFRTLAVFMNKRQSWKRHTVRWVNSLLIQGNRS